MGTIAKRASGVYIIESEMSNPNGDPDCGGAPRLDPFGYGWITPVSVKSKLRYILADPSSPVTKYFMDKYKLDISNFCIFESRAKGFDVAETEVLNSLHQFIEKNGEEALLKRFWDMRLFGTTALEENPDKNTKALNFKRTGCVQMSVPVSVAPVEVVSATVSKKSPLDKANIEKGTGTFGNQSFQVVRHGIYVGTYNVNPLEAPKTQATEEDLELFKALLPRAYDLTPAASRAGMRIVSVLHAEHSDPIGSFNPFDFITAARPKVKEGVEVPLSIADYHIPTLEEVVEATGIENITKLG